MAALTYSSMSTNSSFANNTKSSPYSYNTTMNMSGNMIRTDVFPWQQSGGSSSPHSTSNNNTTTNKLSSLSSLSTPAIGDYNSTNTSSFSSFGSTGTSTDILDFNDWSSSTSSFGNSTTGFDLPPLGLGLTMKREDSLIGRSIGFEAFSNEIDAAPFTSSHASGGTKSEILNTPSMSLAYDVAPSIAPSPTSAFSSTDLLDFAAPSSIPSFPNSTIVPSSSSVKLEAGFMSPSMMSMTSSSNSPRHLSSSSSIDDSSSIDMEPDASADVDAVSDWNSVWSPISTNTPMSPAPPSPLLSSSMPMPYASSRPPQYTESQLAELASRPGPYTRGRAAALAGPVPMNGPRELKPVPVARGPHAGVLGGGEMATVGIYTKDDRWRKIERLREKRRARIVTKTSTGGQYACRKAFADRRPRIGGRFVKMDEETKRYLSLTKPGVVPPSNIEAPAALKAYVAATGHTSSIGGNNTTPIGYSHVNGLAAAAHAAQSSTALTPLFGSDISSQPPMPTFPLSADPLAAAASAAPIWYTYPQMNHSAAVQAVVRA